MNYIPSRVHELIDGIPWGATERVRLFWVRVSDGGRKVFADALKRDSAPEAIVPLIIREPLFLSANSVLADVNRLITGNASNFDSLQRSEDGRLTIVILSKEEFRLPQVSSPITLPRWFPFLGGQETHLRISDLSHQAEVGLLNCPEARIEQVSQLLYDVESAIARRLEAVSRTNPGQLQAFLILLYSDKEVKPATAASVAGFVDHIGTVQDPRAYRASARPSPSLVSRLLRVVLKSSPDELSSHAKKLALAVDPGGCPLLRPPLFAVMLRPANQIDAATRNWHAILLSIYQAYQLTTAAAHAGDYAVFPVSLIYSTSIDLARFLSDATRYVDSLDR